MLGKNMAVWTKMGRVERNTAFPTCANRDTPHQRRVLSASLLQLSSVHTCPRSPQHRLLAGAAVTVSRTCGTLMPNKYGTLMPNKYTVSEKILSSHGAQEHARGVNIAGCVLRAGGQRRQTQRAARRGTPRGHAARRATARCRWTLPRKHGTRTRHRQQNEYKKAHQARHQAADVSHALSHKRAS